MDVELGKEECASSFGDLTPPHQHGRHQHQAVDLCITPYALSEIGLSHFLSINTFLGWRAIVALFLVVSLVAEIPPSHNRPHHFDLTDLAVWNFIALAVTSVLLLTATVYCKVRPSLASKHSPAAWTLCVLYQAVLSSSLFCSLLYWVAVYAQDPIRLDFSLVQQHLLNAIIAFADLGLSRTEFSFKHIVLPLLYIACYFVFTFVYFTITKHFPYPFLDYRNRTDPSMHRPVGQLFGIYLGTVLWAVASTVITVFLSRIKPRHREQAQPL